MSFIEKKAAPEVNYQGQDICRSVLYGMSEFVIVQAKVAEVYFELVLLQ